MSTSASDFSFLAPDLRLAHPALPVLKSPPLLEDFGGVRSGNRLKLKSKTPAEHPLLQRTPKLPEAVATGEPEVTFPVCRLLVPRAGGTK